MYYYDHITWDPTSKQWLVYLNILSALECNDSLEYVTNNLNTHKSVCLTLDSAKNQDVKNGVNYRIVSKAHQIDYNGLLFISKSWNIRQQVCPNSINNIPLSGAIRYATQFDFDKFCFKNPDSCCPYDWNAEVYKAFTAMNGFTKK